jgi:predicted phosphoadenosine phosphosulfate sulfurtransferase
MSSPYEILDPTVISFSGGRTSAFMLHKVLQAGGGNCQAMQ